LILGLIAVASCDEEEHASNSSSRSLEDLSYSAPSPNPRKPSQGTTNNQVIKWIEEGKQFTLAEWVDLISMPGENILAVVSVQQQLQLLYSSNRDAYLDLIHQLASAEPPQRFAVAGLISFVPDASDRSSMIKDQLEGEIRLDAYARFLSDYLRDNPSVVWEHLNEFPIGPMRTQAVNRYFSVVSAELGGLRDSFQKYAELQLTEDQNAARKALVRSVQKNVEAGLYSMNAASRVVDEAAIPESLASEILRSFRDE
jgi:hypothetical protein